MIFNNGSADFLVTTNSTFTVTPEFIGSRLLLKMRKMAEKQLGVLVEKAVISVPAEFDERQRNYTIRAANLAGQFQDSVLKLKFNFNRNPIIPFSQFLTGYIRVFKRKPTLTC